MLHRNKQTGFPASLHFTIAIFSLSVSYAQTTPVNGSFENGLTGWTPMGTGQSESLTMSNFNPSITPTDGSRVGFLTNGPGGISGMPFALDGNGTNDFDPSVLDNTLSFNLFPAVLRFDWNFFTTEQNQPTAFDDFFFVQVSDDIVFSRSASKAAPGVSPFMDAPPGPAGTQTVTSTGVTNGTAAAFQFAGWFSECIPIPDAVLGQNDLLIRLLIADQGDNAFNSGVAFDNIRVESSCADPGDVTLTQVTSSAGTEVENKDGAIIARPALNRNVVVDADGDTMAFIAQADYGNDNPTFLSQVYVFENGQYARSTLFTGDEIQSVDISPSGRWIAFSGRQSENDNLEIYRLDNNNGNLLQITTSDDCENTSPSINSNGRRIGFLSTCGDDIATGFNADGNEDIVVWNNGNFVPLESVNCSNFPPVTRPNGAGQHYAFASDCDFTGGNTDGNLEIFRFNRNNQAIDQITDTTALANLDSVDINTGGNLVSYVGTDVAGNFVIQQWNANNNSITMIGNSSFEPVLAINAHPVANPGSISFERLDILTGEIVINHVDTSTQVITEIARGMGLSGGVVSVAGGVPSVHFSASPDLIGQNSDTNPEIFNGRIE